jgi:hypothetical protein
MEDFKVVHRWIVRLVELLFSALPQAFNHHSSLHRLESPRRIGFLR